MDVVPYYFVMGAFKPGGYHGMGDRLVVRKCRSHSRTSFHILDADLDSNSCHNLIILSIRTYSPLRLLWRVTLLFEGKDFWGIFVTTGR